MEKRLITRREFIRLTTLAGAGAAIAACAPAATATMAPATKMPDATKAPDATKPAATKAPDATKPAATAGPTTPPAAKFKEAPMLAEMVKANKIPAVEKRLPANPWVAATMEQTGKHGGMIRRGYKGVSDRWGPTKMVDKGLAWFDKNLVMQPRLAESWKSNADGSEWTFTLRKGTKWSDGTEATTKDVKWFFDNWLLNKTLTPTPSNALYVTGPKKDVATLKIVDDYTFTYQYKAPNPLLILRVGRAMPGRDILAPGFYLEQWHQDLTKDKDALAAKIKEAGFDGWDKYFIDNRAYWYANPELPVMTGWVAPEPLGKDLFVMKRNPYFFGVDKDGNQLPYFDQVNHRQFQDVNVFNLWITAGEIDFQGRHVDTASFTLYKTNEAKGDYKVVTGISAGHLGFMVNQSTKNDKLREFFQNRDVRIAMSEAIDRERINELIYNGLATPRQYSPLSVSPQYYKKASEAYIKYDVADANKRLDAAGYKKGADGFRTYKDGSPLFFQIEGIDAAGSPNEDAAQQEVKMLNAVGIKCAYKFVERSLYEQHYNANEIEASSWGGDRTVLPLAPEAPIFRGVMLDRPWAAGYGLWKNDPTNASAIEPPADHYIRKIWDLWDKIAVEADPAKQNALFFQILDIWAEEVPMVTVVGEIPAFAIVKNGIKNFVKGFPMDDTTGDEEVYNAETYTWDDPAKHPVNA